MATCKNCGTKVVWAAPRDRVLPFEPTVAGTGTVAVARIRGSLRARPHRGHPWVQAYRIHDCPRRRRNR